LAVKFYWKIILALLLVLLMASAVATALLGRLVWQLQSENARLRSEVASNAQSQQSATEKKLYDAAMRGQRATLKAILDANPELINVTTADNRATPLHLAAVNGRAWISAELIRRGADINATNTFGNTPVHNAVNSGNADTMTELLKAKPDLSIRNYAGQTPLQYAVARNRKELAELLRAAGPPE
jgi:ankyrin repeat protein